MRHRGKADGDIAREKPVDTPEKPMEILRKADGDAAEKPMELLRKSHGDTVEERPLRAA
jgi:hypothetical protein